MSKKTYIIKGQRSIKLLSSLLLFTLSYYSWSQEVASPDQYAPSSGSHFVDSICSPSSNTTVSLRDLMIVASEEYIQSLNEQVGECPAHLMGLERVLSDSFSSFECSQDRVICEDTINSIIGERLGFSDLQRNEQCLVARCNEHVMMKDDEFRERFESVKFRAMEVVNAFEMEKIYDAFYNSLASNLERFSMIMGEGAEQSLNRMLSAQPGDTRGQPQNLFCGMDTLEGIISNIETFPSCRGAENLRRRLGEGVPSIRERVEGMLGSFVRIKGENIDPGASNADLAQMFTTEALNVRTFAGADAVSCFPAALTRFISTLPSASEVELMLSYKGNTEQFFHDVVYGDLKDNDLFSSLRDKEPLMQIAYLNDLRNLMEREGPEAAVAIRQNLGNVFSSYINYLDTIKGDLIRIETGELDPAEMAAAHNRLRQEYVNFLSEENNAALRNGMRDIYKGHCDSFVSKMAEIVCNDNLDRTLPFQEVSDSLSDILRDSGASEWFESEEDGQYLETILMCRYSYDRYASVEEAGQDPRRQSPYNSLLSRSESLSNEERSRSDDMRRASGHFGQLCQMMEETATSLPSNVLADIGVESCEGLLQSNTKCAQATLSYLASSGSEAFFSLINGSSPKTLEVRRFVHFNLAIAPAINAEHADNSSQQESLFDNRVVASQDAPAQPKAASSSTSFFSRFGFGQSEKVDKQAVVSGQVNAPGATNSQPQRLEERSFSNPFSSVSARPGSFVSSSADGIKATPTHQSTQQSISAIESENNELLRELEEMQRQLQNAKNSEQTNASAAVIAQLSQKIGELEAQIERNNQKVADLQRGQPAQEGIGDRSPRIPYANEDTGSNLGGGRAANNTFAGGGSGANFSPSGNSAPSATGLGAGPSAIAEGSGEATSSDQLGTRDPAAVNNKALSQQVALEFDRSDIQVVQADDQTIDFLERMAGQSPQRFFEELQRLGVNDTSFIIRDPNDQKEYLITYTPNAENGLIEFKRELLTISNEEGPQEADNAVIPTEEAPPERSNLYKQFIEQEREARE